MRMMSIVSRKETRCSVKTEASLAVFLIFYPQDRPLKTYKLKLLRVSHVIPSGRHKSTNTPLGLMGHFFA